MVRVIGYIDSNKQCLKHTHTQTTNLSMKKRIIYYPLEVSRGKYWGSGVFLLQYFSLVRI